MKDDIEEKIRMFCKKSDMKMDKFSINLIEEGYVATDGYVSIMFDKEGKVSSLPMYKPYGNGITTLIGKGYSIIIYVVITIIILITICGMIK